MVCGKIGWLKPWNILNYADHEDIAPSIINTGLDYKNSVFNEVFTSVILVKKNPNLTAIVCGVIDMLRKTCEKKTILFFIYNFVS